MHLIVLHILHKYVTSYYLKVPKTAVLSVLYTELVGLTLHLKEVFTWDFRVKKWPIFIMYYVNLRCQLPTITNFFEIAPAVFRERVTNIHTYKLSRF